jgi:SAM-dependent methyltransferase
MSGDAPRRPGMTAPPRRPPAQRAVESPARGGPRPTLEDVRACYRLILGREPENESVLERHLAQVASFADLRQRFLQSDEFRARGVPDATPRLTLAPDSVPVDVLAEGPALDAMLARIGTYWEKIGGEAPHWSVLTQDRFRPDAIAESLDAFYATGSNDRMLVEGLLKRHGIARESLPLCLEYGCGVGRATLALAKTFATVLGCDISQPHLDLAAEQAAARGVANLAWHRSTVGQPMPSGGWDCWYSRIVLQHNPPPVIAHLLRHAFAGLRPGGVAIFQVPTHRVGYRFSVADYLASTREPEMEMHILPQRQVFALAREAGLEVLEVREDTHLVASNALVWLSNMFMLRRPPDGSAPAG